MKSPKFFATVSLLLIVVLALSACAPSQEASESSEPVEAAEDASGDEESMDEESMDEESMDEVSNAVTVEDQALGMGNTVVIASVTSDVAGWMVIHIQADGGPGPIIGNAPVAAGENSNVVVEIDVSMATETLYAMLHVDAGSEGDYEFPGEDTPASDADGNVVTPAFSLAIPNAVSVEDQELVDGNTVTIASVSSKGPGWIVIHIQADGGPGPIIGQAPVSAGYNSNVVVEIDTSIATETLYAMLHVDAGSEGDYEFPGEDAPASDADGNIVTPSFTLLGE